MSIDPLFLAPETGRRSVPDSATGRLFQHTDWEQTPLGAIATWPQSLRVAVSICLNSRFPMFVWWGPTLVNIYNDAYIPYLGKRHPQAFGKPARDTWSDIWPVLAPQVAAVMEDGQASWNERVLLTMERNGFSEDTYFTWSYSPVYDERGGIGGLYCACVEETPRVEAERERDALMRQAQTTAATLHTWFDNAPGFVALLRGPDMVFEMVNKAYYQLVGHRPLQGRPAFDALPELRHQGYEELLQNVYQNGEPFVGRALRLVVQREPGGPLSEVFMDLVYQPVLDGDRQVVGIFVQGHDVTEQVQAALALQQADRRKDEFLATLAHELRNPLAPIRQAAELARNPALGATRQGWALDVIQRQSQQMALLLEDLLDVSRISLGRLELRPEPVRLAAVVEAAVETVRPLVDARRHRLTIDLPAHPLVIRADPLRLAQVLSNLLSNAAKYSDEGGTIQLSAALEDGEVVLSVRDAGIGLSPASMAPIFEMFSQVSSALDRAGGGLGIGLALSRGLVEMHGGRIEARSEGLGHGSEFIVRLPWTAGENLHEAGPAAGRSPGAASRRVLVVDDNRDAGSSLALLLELEGHEVHVVVDGKAALQVAAELRPAVAVLDIGMPGMNGYQLAEAVRATDWGASALLIALTGWGQAEDLDRARAAGFDHHCTKPVDPDRIIALIAGAQEAAPAPP